MSKPRNRFPTTTMVPAVAARARDLAASGWTLAEAQREIGVPRETLRHWANREGVAFAIRRTDRQRAAASANLVKARRQLHAVLEALTEDQLADYRLACAKGFPRAEALAIAGRPDLARAAA